MYRQTGTGIEVFLVHPGGPFWAKKDLGAWSIPKGEYTEEEPPRDAALREFREETGFEVSGEPIALGTIKQSGSKTVSVWTIEGDCDPTRLISNTCEIEWPPRSGGKMEIPEVDRGAWYTIPEARERILKGQQAALDMLQLYLR